MRYDEDFGQWIRHHVHKCVAKHKSFIAVYRQRQNILPHKKRHVNPESNGLIYYFQIKNWNKNFISSFEIEWNCKTQKSWNFKTKVCTLSSALPLTSLIAWNKSVEHRPDWKSSIFSLSYRCSFICFCLVSLSFVRYYISISRLSRRFLIY